MDVFYSQDQLPLKELFPGFDARLIHADGLTVAHVTIAAGSALPEHHHVHEQITNVIHGELEMTVAGQTAVCNAGTSIVIPSNAPHSARALTDCYVIDVFQPVREDYR
jgi:quercetin dioxygenase-like cupin family protein